MDAAGVPRVAVDDAGGACGEPPVTPRQLRWKRQCLTTADTRDDDSRSGDVADRAGLPWAAAGATAGAAEAREVGGAAATTIQDWVEGQSQEPPGVEGLSVAVRGGLPLAGAAAVASPDPTLLGTWRQRRRQASAASLALGGVARAPTADGGDRAFAGGKGAGRDKAEASRGNWTDPASLAASSGGKEMKKRRVHTAAVAKPVDADAEAGWGVRRLPLTPSVSRPVPIVLVDDSDDGAAGGAATAAVAAAPRRRDDAAVAGASASPAAALAADRPPAGAPAAVDTPPAPPPPASALSGATADVAAATPAVLATAVAASAGQGLPPPAAERLGAALARAAAEEEITGHVAATHPPAVIARRLLAYYPRAPSGAVPWGTLASVELFLSDLQRAATGAPSRVG